MNYYYLAFHFDTSLQYTIHNRVTKQLNENKIHNKCESV